MDELKKGIEEYRKGKEFWMFLKDLIDNDTLIILGLLLIAAWVVKDVQLLIIGGLLTTLKNAKGK